jgi:hypothetical protein
MGRVIITCGKADKFREFGGYVIVKYETYRTNVDWLLTPLYNHSDFMRTFKLVLFNLSKLRSKNFPDDKNYTQFFFLFWCQEYKYSNEGQVWVRHSLRSCLNVRNPYFILLWRPIFAWHCFMAIIVMWFVACTIKAGQSPMLPKIRSLPFSLCGGLRIFLLLLNIFCCTHKLYFSKLIIPRLSRDIHLFPVY